MNKKLILSLLALAGVPALMMAADDARLLRFPATNGNEIVFSYAGDLYKVPAKGGEAQRLTSHVGYEMFFLIAVVMSIPAFILAATVPFTHSSESK